MNKSNIDIHSIFPTPVLAYNVELEEKEKLFLMSQYPDNVKANQGNLMSKDINILKRPEVQKLNKKLLFLLNDAFTRVHNPLNGCNLYITQSWLNFTGRDQYHHRHLHPNSFFSATLYLQVTEEDSTTFFRPGSATDNYEIPSSHYGTFNSGAISLPVRDNLLLIFPSTLSHSVANVKHDTLRVTLSFNTYLKGEIGSPTNLNHLIL
jgi:uncharacterized protein (TIGR02466 family)